MPEYLKVKKVMDLSRLPLEGSLDLTYRCNNNCRHCWINIPAGSPEKEKELTFDEITEIVDEARKMGCRRWSISGGEPMLRPDFADIFDYITRKSATYSINTNGTLITPEIAGLMKRKGVKMVALYGASSEVHDHITRNPGSFEAAMQGMSYLKEAGVSFMVQLIPMRDNYFQLDEMIRLAESQSRFWKLGAAWLYLSACGDPKRNEEIKGQRLSPEEVVNLDPPDLSFDEWLEKEEVYMCHLQKEDDRLFATCITRGRSFHIDPYGQMTFCQYIQDPALRYDLRRGNFKECWEVFIPSLADRVRGGKEYLENCGACDLKGDCGLCPSYAYLEHRRFPAKVEYLCALARENKKFKDNWQKNHRIYFEVAGITIQVESDLPISEATFPSKFKLFKVNGPGEDTISIRHHFSLPDLDGRDLGEEVYRKIPWAIYRKGNSWIYKGIYHGMEDKDAYLVAVFSHDHTRVEIYNDNFRKQDYLDRGLGSLTMFATDQILLSRVLADREGCYFHASGVILDGKGLLFVGHSDAGKSTIVKMLKDKAEILCDDRMIVRRWPEGFRIHGNWSNGEVSDVSANSAPLRAIMFLQHANENRLLPLENRRIIITRLLACLIKPFVTADWWEKMLSLVEKVVREIPCYSLHFDKSGRVKDVLERLEVKRVGDQVMNGNGMGDV